MRVVGLEPTIIRGKMGIIRPFANLKGVFKITDTSDEIEP